MNVKTEEEDTDDETDNKEPSEVESNDVVKIKNVTETHSMGYMWKDKRIPYWWLCNSELWTAAFGSFFCAYNV